ncbi:MAG: capsule assembly Wzi family protein [Treponema sp.]|jgi:hypothetical protein|nr:capsule assembly Wzi family protein [Treponema sp.]
MTQAKNYGYPLFLSMLCFIAGLGQLWAEPFSIIPAGDPIIEDIRFVTRESGMSFRSLTPPFSRDEVQQILDSIDPSALSAAAQEAYIRIQNKLHPQTIISDSLFSFSVHITAAAEGRLRTNAAIPWTQGDTASPFMLSIPLNFYFANRVQLNLEPILAADPSFYETDGSWGTNIPYKIERIDMNMPLRGFFAAGGAWWNFQLGRDRLSFGAGRTGNLVISDTPDYYDFVRTAFFSPHFKYSILISQMPLSLANMNIDKTKYAITDKTVTETVQRYIYVHRMDIKPLKNVSVALTEGLMVGNAPLELRYLNPFAIFHNFFPWQDYDSWAAGYDMTGSIFSCDVEWTIIPSLAVYGQFVLNEFSTSYELARWPDTQPPNALGYLAGIEYLRGFTGWRAVFYGEFVYTDPYLYVNNSPFASYIWMRRLSDITSKDLRYQWIGYPDGRDALVFAAGSSFFKEDRAFSVDLAFIRKGEHTIRWDWGIGTPYTDERTPTGTAENKLTATIKGMWKPLSWITLSGTIAGSMIFDMGHTKGTNAYGLETILSLALTY